MSEDVISIREAAKRLKVSESTIRRYFDQELLRGYVTPSGTRRILRESVVRLEEESGLAPPGITFK